MKHYLVLLGLYQSCRYKGVNFLRFLMSGERDLDYFCRKGQAREPLPAIQLYPDGFIPPHFTSKEKKAAVGRATGEVQALTGGSAAGGQKADPGHPLFTSPGGAAQDVGDPVLPRD